MFEISSSCYSRYKGKILSKELYWKLICKFQQEENEILSNFINIWCSYKHIVFISAVAQKLAWISSWFLILFATFICQPNFRSKILETIIINLETWHFQNVVCLFCAFNIAWNIKNFVQISTILVLFKKTEIWTSNIESTKNADHFLKMPGLGELCGNCFKSHTC